MSKPMEKTIVRRISKKGVNIAINLLFLAIFKASGRVENKRKTEKI